MVLRSFPSDAIEEHFWFSKQPLSEQFLKETWREEHAIYDICYKEPFVEWMLEVLHDTNKAALSRGVYSLHVHASHVVWSE